MVVSCDLDLEPMTFIYKLDLYPLKSWLPTKNELSRESLSKVIVLQTYIHNPPKIRRRFAGGKTHKEL